MSSVIKINQIKKRYGTLQALNDISLSIEEGEFFGLLGPNGAGKTTLINILSGLTKADSGHILVYGHNTISDFRKARRMLGVVPQELVFDPFFTVRETLRIQPGYYGLKPNDNWIDEILQKLGLTEKANTNMRSLSGGMKRRMLIAQALVHRPPIIVLDEPTAGVDVQLRQMIWKFVSQLNREGHTILLTTHYLEEAQALCNRVAMFHCGKISSLERTQDLLKQFFRLQLKVTFSIGVLPANLKPHLVDDSTDKMKPLDSSRNAHYILRLNNYEEIEKILAQCREAGCQLEDVEIKKTDLEDIFLKLTNEYCR